MRLDDLTIGGGGEGGVGVGVGVEVANIIGLGAT